MLRLEYGVTSNRTTILAEREAPRRPHAGLVETAVVQRASFGVAPAAIAVDSLRKVVNRSSGFDANFMGLSRETADLACRRLQARQVTCFMIGPG